ncbi:MAG: hypothetical protein CSA05_03720 [Bacteroidia bacterium]|nr:MAG: hypothetical protein CSA05_03720 [Bacteroidia bacterium]
MNKEIAKEIFEEFEHIDVLYCNPRGEFFTKQNLAENSLQEGEKFETITREEALLVPKEETTKNGQ